MLERGLDVRPSGGKLVAIDPVLKRTKLDDRRGKLSFDRRKRSTARAATDHRHSRARVRARVCWVLSVY